MFENISIGVKPFLRDPQLFHTIQSIRTNLPGAQMIICDCGDHSEEKEGIFADLERDGHKTIQLDFDSGFGAMGNAIVDALDRDFLLIGSDDFEFGPVEVREGIEKLQEVLTLNPDIDIASGRVNNRPYEFDLIDEGDKVTEVPVRYNVHDPIFPWYQQADLTVNYFLARKEVFQKVRWDNDVKIGGGEHGSFFVDCKRSGVKTVYVTGVNINEQQVKNSPRYNLYRRRAMDPARPCFDRRGIKKYVMGNGQVDYDAVNN